MLSSGKEDRIFGEAAVGNDLDRHILERQPQVMGGLANHVEGIFRGDRVDQLDEFQSGLDLTRSAECRLGAPLTYSDEAGGGRHRRLSAIHGTAIILSSYHRAAAGTDRPVRLGAAGGQSIG